MVTSSGNKQILGKTKTNNLKLSPHKILVKVRRIVKFLKMEPQPRYRLIESEWTTDLGRQEDGEQYNIRLALEPSRTPYLISISILILKDWQEFETDVENVANFVSCVLGVPVENLKNVVARKNRAKQRLKLIVDFRGPFLFRGHCGFFSATKSKIFTTHTEYKTFIGRVEQPQIEEFLTKELYDGYMIDRYGAQ